MNSIENYERENGVFNLGVFTLGPIYLILNGKKIEGFIWLLLILSLIFSEFLYLFFSIFVILIPFFITCYYIPLGNSMLWKHNKCKSIEDFNKINKTWNIISLIVLIFEILTIYIIINF